jgi:hypothetical protein
LVEKDFSFLFCFSLCEFSDFASVDSVFPTTGDSSFSFSTVFLELSTNVTIHFDRDGFHRGNNSVSPRSSATSQLDGKIKENNEEGNKMSTHTGIQSESAVSGEKKMNEIKSEIVLTEMKDPISMFS